MKPRKRVKYVCSRCGSDKIRRNADTVWNVTTQQWEIVALYDNTDCEQCECECNTEEAEL